MPARHVVRFAVGSPDGPRSAVWRLWTTGNHVYISARLYGDTFKVSLHESGKWRWAFTKEYAASETSLLPPGSTRVIEEWERPPEIMPGITSAFMVVVPATELATPRHTLSEEAHRKYTGGVHWVPPPPPGTSTHFMILFIAPGGPSPESSQNEFISYFKLPSGETLAVMVHKQPMLRKHEELLAAARQAIAQWVTQTDLGAVLSAAQEPRGWLYGHNDYGTRFLVDISGVFLTE